MPRFFKKILCFARQRLYLFKDFNSYFLAALRQKLLDIHQFIFCRFEFFFRESEQCFGVSRIFIIQSSIISPTLVWILSRFLIAISKLVPIIVSARPRHSFLASSVLFLNSSFLALSSARKVSRSDFNFATKASLSAFIVALNSSRSSRKVCIKALRSSRKPAPPGPRFPSSARATGERTTAPTSVKNIAMFKYFFIVFVLNL